MYTFTSIPSNQWESLTPDVSYPQSLLYGHLQESREIEVLRYLIIKDDQSVGYFQALVFPLIQNKTSIYIPYGPVLTQSTPDLFDELGVFLRGLASEKNAIFVRTDFELFELSEKTLPSLYKKIPLFAYKTAYHQPRGEWILNIKPDEQSLLANMHKKTRYNINKSLKQNLETSFYEGKDIVAWADTFIALNEQNTTEHNTTTHPKSYFKSLFEVAGKNKENFIAVTRKEGHVLAINIFIITETTVFCPFGASNKLGKELGAYYHIKWSSILEMKKRGISNFNWGGISVGISDDHLSGVTRFKQGFGGEELHHGLLHDIVTKPFWYYLYLFRKFVKK